MAELASTQMTSQLACNLKRIISLYFRFVIQTILMDMDFNKVIPEIPEFIINMSAASEHVAEVERYIRVIKERCWVCMGVVPFKRIPNIMSINMVHFCAFGEMCQ